jgi:hypothetical protein
MRTLLLSHRENEKCGFKKYIKVMSKKNFNSNQMKNRLMKCIEIFLIYIFSILNDVIVINFILGSPFHIKFFNLLQGFFYQSHV